MTKFLREPLVHFILLGAALFLGHSLWQHHVTKADYTITIDPAEITRQATIFAAENRRDPTDEDMEALLFAHVEEQVLMREAQRLGLGEDDTIIRRRLAQKMRFMISDVGAPALPKDKELEAWYDANLDLFVAPETRSFRHIYLSPQSRGSALEADALAVKAAASEQSWDTLGDPFMLPRSYNDVTQKRVVRDFGREFTSQIFALKPGEWSAPIGSALGLHVVSVDAITPAATPSFKAARLDVENAWLEAATRQTNEERLEALLAKYKVEVVD